MALQRRPWLCRWVIIKQGLLVFIIFCSLFFPGCWGYREIDETAHVLLLGIDKGKENVLTLTALIAVPRQMGGGGGSGAVGGGGGGSQKPSITITVESRTILTGLDMINAVIERRATLDHLKVILFAEEIAKEGLDQYLMPLMRYPEFRRTVFLGICRQNCKELLDKFQPLLEANPSKYAELFMGTQRYVGFIPFNQTHHFYVDLKSKSVQPVCALLGLERKEEVEHEKEPWGMPEGDFIAGQLPRQGGNKIEVIGAAVFHGARMVGTINGSETVLVNILRGWFKESFFAFPDPAGPDRFIILRFFAQRKPEIKIHFNPGGIPVVNVRVPLDAEITSVQSGINYERPEKLPILEQELNRRLEIKTRQLIRKTQDEFCSDIFGFGFKARRLVTTYSQWEKINWPELYPRAIVQVTFDAQIRRIGLLRKTTKLR